MAETGRFFTRTVKAGVDLRTKQYHILRASAAGITVLASNAAEGPDGTIGVLANKPNSGQAASVVYAGEFKVVVGSATTANALLTTNGAGRAVSAGIASGDFSLGMGLEAATADGQVIRCLINMPAVQVNSA